jgi:hypothetical protein
MAEFKKEAPKKEASKKAVCDICCESRKNFFICKNRDCQMKTCCIICMKKYLLESSLGPHCMCCRNEIPTSDFITFFEKNWRLGAYKDHHKDILFAKENSKLNEAYEAIEKKKQISELDTEINRLKGLIGNLMNAKDDILYGTNTGTGKVTKSQNEYKYKCPSESCNGSLNSNYKCVICDVNYCKDCFEVIVDKDTHECDEGLKETVKEIKKQAKPCPSCGTMISKISGCSQLFCTNGTCGTAFNWNTGAIEQGVIHNPEAFDYFQKHPDKKVAYLSRLNARNNNDEPNENCVVNQFQMGDKLRQLKLSNTECNMILLLVRNIYNFRENGRRQPYLPNNLDLRMKYVKNEITEVNMKKTIFMRHKKFEKERIDHQILGTAAHVMNDILRLILVCKSIAEYDDIAKVALTEIVEYTNEQLENNGKYFGLKALVIDNSFI